MSRRNKRTGTIAAALAAAFVLWPRKSEAAPNDDEDEDGAGGGQGAGSAATQNFAPSGDPEKPPGQVGGLDDTSLDITVTEEPTEGAWYRIRFGDSFIGVARRALVVDVAPNVRMNAVRMIEEAPQNAALRRIPTESAYVRTYTGDDIISFSPPYQLVYIPKGLR